MGFDSLVDEVMLEESRALEEGKEVKQELVIDQQAQEISGVSASWPRVVCGPTIDWGTALGEL